MKNIDFFHLEMLCLLASSGTGTELAKMATFVPVPELARTSQKLKKERKVL